MVVVAAVLNPLPRESLAQLSLSLHCLRFRASRPSNEGGLGEILHMGSQLFRGCLIRGFAEEHEENHRHWGKDKQPDAT